MCKVRVSSFKCVSGVNRVELWLRVCRECWGIGDWGSFNDSFKGVLRVRSSGVFGSAMVCMNVSGVIGERLFMGVGVGVGVLGVLGGLGLGLGLIARTLGVTHCSSVGL